MKLTSILVLAMATGTALGQNPDIIQNTQNTMNAVQQKKTIDSNAALAASQGQPAPPSATPSSTPAPAAKPVPAAPKPAATAKPVSATAAKSTPAPAVKTSSVTASPKPAATATVKTTSVAAKPATATAAKPSPAATVKPATATSAKPAATATLKPAAATSAKPATTATLKPAAVSAPVRVVPQSSGAKATAKKAVAVKAPQVIAAPAATSKKPAAKKQPAVAKTKSESDQKVEVESKASSDASKDVPKAINLTGRRDPFISPVVNRAMVGSGCSSGKKCLAIDQVALKGVVKADTGMIAVVVNAMNKAYFLRENDPVFNGYVVRITGDSIVFKETIQDKLGKPFTREVTKKITTSAV